jgi:light-regulated signal transduction histidine kinase (bacteriophytochrome)
VAKRPVKVSALVSEVLLELEKDRGNRSIEIHVGDLPDCQGDESLLRQVFINLLSNAIKFTRNRNPAVIDIGCLQQKGELVYHVGDNGAGFDLQYAKKLFGVFQRMHRVEEFEGTGVGLSIVERIIVRHGGRIWAEAEVEKGATFYFTLPGDPQA